MNIQTGLIFKSYFNDEKKEVISVNTSTKQVMVKSLKTSKTEVLNLDMLIYGLNNLDFIITSK